MTINLIIKKAVVSLGLVMSLGCASEVGNPNSSYCSKDMDCKGDRICSKGVCVEQSGYGGGEKSNNKCGNSPLYSKYLWEISGCKGSFHMREDCVVGGSDYNEDGYNYDSGYTYNNFSINSPSGLFFFDPNFRFTDGVNQNPKWGAVNKQLDKYGGYVLRIPDCKADHLDDCAYVPVDKPFKNRDDCRNSVYYVP
ncbi:hypothetical protein HYX11_02240 [Candidatus Woesearchaeota archaeon]|nr:hypothetical protein [Candidatus Woesearchaeota archaeon]